MGTKIILNYVYIYNNNIKIIKVITKFLIKNIIIK